VDLFYCIPASQVMTGERVDEWRGLFRNEPPVSAYDEIKRKNEQLQEMAEKVKASEEQYKLLTNTLPLIIFSMNETGRIIYSNKWLNDYTGYSLDDINTKGWQAIIHPSDYEDFKSVMLIRPEQRNDNTRLQCRVRHQISGHYLWHMISLSNIQDSNSNIIYRIGFMADIHAQKVFEEALQDNMQLKETQTLLKQNEANLQDIISELNRSNLELQQFAYIASHDLQEPVRKLLYYSDTLLSKYAPQLDAKAAGYLNNMAATSRRMRELIKDLLTFSQVNQVRKNFQEVDLNSILNESLQNLELVIKEKQGIVNAGLLPKVKADPGLMLQLFQNLVSNSLKYSREDVKPVLEITSKVDATHVRLYFKDNGIGFDEKYLGKLFTLFQRLHNREQYEGTGLGLAICRKIMEVHNGTITAASKLGEGATFIIALPMNVKTDG
jgi:PAS domain S-box-containing protein